MQKTEVNTSVFLLMTAFRNHYALTDQQVVLLTKTVQEIYTDGTYTANAWLIDAWSPSGMLSADPIDLLTIRGSLWDDWHVGVKKLK